MHYRENAKYVFLLLDFELFSKINYITEEIYLYPINSLYNPIKVSSDFKVIIVKFAQRK